MNAPLSACHTGPARIEKLKIISDKPSYPQSNPDWISPSGLLGSLGFFSSKTETRWNFFNLKTLFEAPYSNFLKSRGPTLRVTSSETCSVCVKQALNTCRWLVNVLVTWHVSYKIMTLLCTFDHQFFGIWGFCWVHLI